MNNSQVAQAFVEGKEKGTGSNLRINYDYLYSYDTEIARRTFTGGIAVNPIKYMSPTTGRQKSHLLHALFRAGYVQTDDRLSVRVFYDGGYHTVEFITYRKPEDIENWGKDGN